MLKSSLSHTCRYTSSFLGPNKLPMCLERCTSNYAILAVPIFVQLTARHRWNHIVNLLVDSGLLGLTDLPSAMKPSAGKAKLVRIHWIRDSVFCKAKWVCWRPQVLWVHWNLNLRARLFLKEHKFPNQKRELIAFFYTVSPPEKLKTSYIIHYLQIIKFSEKQQFTTIILFARVYKVLRHRGRCSLDWDVRQSP